MALFEPEHQNAETGRAERYRVAAEHALQQLDWAAGYLYRIRKRDVAKALARNRDYIRRSLMRTP
jgi:hypothetical protein